MQFVIHNHAHLKHSRPQITLSRNLSHDLLMLSFCKSQLLATLILNSNIFATLPLLCAIFNANQKNKSGV